MSYVLELARAGIKFCRKEIESADYDGKLDEHEKLMKNAGANVKEKIWKTLMK